MALPVRSRDGVKFGKELREKDFLFDEGYLNLNHGSFGTYPRPVKEVLHSFQEAAEARPDGFIRYKYPTHLNESRKAIADLIKAPLKTVVFVPNATIGVNTILRNLTFAEGEYILYFATIYKGCGTTIQYITESTPAKSVMLEYTYPVEDDWLVAAFRQKVREIEDGGGKVKIAVFDTVHLIRSTLPTSWGFKTLDSVPNTINPKNAFGGDVESEYVGNFEFVGTIDSSPYMCVPKALEWRKDLGGEKVIIQYCTSLAQNAGLFLARSLGTEMMDNETKTLSQCCMAMVRLPIGVGKAQQTGDTIGLGKDQVAREVTLWLLRKMLDDYNTFLQTFFYGGAWWVRLSGQVYLELSDFEAAAPLLKELCERAEKGEWAEGLGKN
ncbi:hypothetical protein N0V95_008717 [Ascochyta clinopodiicola]|nr:hypothetical protein N0V95_008717 [Ascochyta clinopodiicola]